MAFPDIPNVHALATLLLTVLALFLFTREKIPLESTSLFILVALIIGFELFPFQGRTIFESIGGSLSHETLKAGDLRNRYLDRLVARKDELHSLCRTTGWHLGLHHTGDSAQSALLWLYRALDGGAQ